MTGRERGDEHERPTRRLALPLAALEDHGAFVARHIGTDAADQAAMLRALGFASRAALIDAIVPAAIRERDAAARCRRR